MQFINPDWSLCLNKKHIPLTGIDTLGTEALSLVLPLGLRTVLSVDSEIQKSWGSYMRNAVGHEGYFPTENRAIVGLFDLNVKLIYIAEVLRKPGGLPYVNQLRGKCNALAPTSLNNTIITFLINTLKKDMQ